MTDSRDDVFVEGLTRCHNAVYRFIATLVPNRADAEELLQETAITAWRERDRYDPQREIFPWLCGIARNLIGHYHRRQSMARRLEPQIVEQLLMRQMQQEPALQVRLEALHHCLEKLPDRQRELVKDYYNQEITIRDFAQRRQQTAEAVYKMLQRTRQLLYECMSRTAAGQGI